MDHRTRDIVTVTAAFLDRAYREVETNPQPRGLAAGHIRWGEQRAEYFVPRGTAAGARVQVIDPLTPIHPFTEVVVQIEGLGTARAQIQRDLELHAAELRIVGDERHAVWPRSKVRSAALIGCGRLGSKLAGTIARMALLDELILVDDDVLEAHSLDAVEAFPWQVGRKKASALAEALSERGVSTRLNPLDLSVEDSGATAEVLAADLILTAPDSNRARLAAAQAATVAMRPHLDVGTGISSGSMGGDVRLAMPGSGCLLCIGGLDLDQIRSSDFRQERAGSLHSLNGLVAGQAVALIQPLVLGEPTASRWVRIDIDQRGLVRSQDVVLRSEPRCTLCGEVFGSGTSGLDQR
jgi:hypothetical protein